MLANNCGGMHAQMHGHRRPQRRGDARSLLYDGTRLQLGWMTEAELSGAIASGGGARARSTRSSALCATATPTRSARGYPEAAAARLGLQPRRAPAGRDGRFNVARALVGSEGTCVTMLEATLRLVDDPPVRAVGGARLRRRVRGRRCTCRRCSAFEPLALEGIDDVLYRAHRRRRAACTPKHLALLPDGERLAAASSSAAHDARSRSREPAR